MELFRGYVALIDDSKRARGKYSNDDLLISLEEAKQYKGYSGKLKEDVILIDIDITEQANRFLELVKNESLCTRVYKTTRGYHFYFKNDRSYKQCATNIKVALGLRVDVKVGSSNCIGTLKIDGKERKIVYDKINNNEEYDILPAYLRRVNSKDDFFDLAEGDGRNSKLYSYIITLIKSSFTKAEIINTIEFINKYIFKNPLPDSELAVILRDESFNVQVSKSFFSDKGLFLHHVFSEFLIEELNIKKINGQIHFYDSTHYKTDINILENKMLHYIPHLRHSQRVEVLKTINVIKCSNENHNNFVNYISFKNGIYDINNNILLEHDPNYIICNHINVDFNPDAYNKTLDIVFNKLSCNDINIRLLLEELVGYCFFRRNELRKSFFLLGDRRNGKSTFIELLNKLLGEDNVTHLELKELNERFKTAMLANKLANLGDDISDEFIKDLSLFKKLVSGDNVVGEFKGKDIFSFKPYAKFIFSANSLPRIYDSTSAVLDRMILIPFNATFSKSDPDYDPFIIDKLLSKSSLEYLVQLGINALHRVLDKREFTHCNVIEDLLVEYNSQNNPILGFFEDLSNNNIEELVGKTTENIYSAYLYYCDENRLSAKGKSTFIKDFLKHFPNLTIKRKRVDGVLKKLIYFKD